jgi:hypothetical protein
MQVVEDIDRALHGVGLGTQNHIYLSHPDE